MRKLTKKIYFKIGHLCGFFKDSNVNSDEVPLYNIGNVKNRNTEIDGLIPQAISIGDNFVSSVNTYIIAHDASLYNHIKKHRIEKVDIGDNVFIGLGAIVLPGVKIGDGAIIGAGSVVTKNVESYTVVAGNPARFMSTVEQYIEKCKSRNVLFDTPESFEKYYTNDLNRDDIIEFQNKYLDENK